MTNRKRIIVLSAATVSLVALVVIYGTFGGCWRPTSLIERDMWSKLTVGMNVEAFEEAANLQGWKGGVIGSGVQLESGAIVQGATVRVQVCNNRWWYTNADVHFDAEGELFDLRVYTALNWP